MHLEATGDNPSAAVAHTRANGQPRPVVVGILSRLSVGTSESSWSYRLQEDAGRWFAEQRQWQVLELPYRDVNVSAYRPGVRRPAYEQMLADLRAGRIQGIVVWKTDRLVRNLEELARLEGLLDDTGGFVVSVKEPVDTREPGGREALRNYAWAAHREAASIAERQEARHGQLAREGRYKGGGLRPFGYDASCLQLDEYEAALIREPARRVLDEGWTFAAVAADWYEGGVLGTTGRRIRAYQVRRILESPRVAGMREHKQEIVGPAAWPAVLDRLTWERIRALPRQAGRPRQRHEYLLDGELLRCGSCGHQMRGVWYRPNGAKEYSAYRCPGGTQRPSYAMDACGRVFVCADRVDELVTRRALERLAMPGALAALRRRCDRLDATVEAARATIAEQMILRRRVEEAIERRQLTNKQHSAALERIDRRSAVAQDVIEASRLRATGGVNIWLLPPDDVDALHRAFVTLKVEERRALIGLAVELVTILPSSKRAGSRFNPDRVRLRDRQIDPHPAESSSHPR
jgi:site-specific DNA recombinase